MDFDDWNELTEEEREQAEAEADAQVEAADNEARALRIFALPDVFELNLAAEAALLLS